MTVCLNKNELIWKNRFLHLISTILFTILISVSSYLNKNELIWKNRFLHLI